MVDPLLKCVAAYAKNTDDDAPNDAREKAVDVMNDCAVANAKLHPGEFDFVIENSSGIMRWAGEIIMEYGAEHGNLDLCYIGRALGTLTTKRAEWVLEWTYWRAVYAQQEETRDLMKSWIAERFPNRLKWL